MSGRRYHRRHRVPLKVAAEQVVKQTKVCLRGVWFHVCYPVGVKKKLRWGMIHSSAALFGVDWASRTFAVVHTAVGETGMYGASAASLLAVLAEYVHVPE